MNMNDPAQKYPACMLDLETLGLTPGSVIFAIGAQMFDPVTNELGPDFYTLINIANSVSWEMNINPETVQWWEQNPPDSKDEYTRAYASSILLPAALIQFTEFFLGNGTEECTLWGNGSDFDIPILKAAYRKCKFKEPWKFRNTRCFRTLKTLVRLPYTEPQIPHHASYDAVAQAEHALKIFEWAKTRGIQLSL